MSAKVLVLGSINYDITFMVDHLVRPGETLQCTKHEIGFGGKGLNQAISLFRAGCETYFAGAKGAKDGEEIATYIRSVGFSAVDLYESDQATGSAFIQVSSNGENSIVLNRGANFDVPHLFVDQVLSKLSSDDYIVLQNEINSIDYIVEQARSRGIHIVLNPSPFTTSIRDLGYSAINVLFVNEIEAGMLFDTIDPSAIQVYMQINMKDSLVVMTLGSKGAYAITTQAIHHIQAKQVDVIDSTGAGDCFTGYFLSEYIVTGDIDSALQRATHAASITVTRKGASSSIPFACELDTLSD